MKRRTDFSDWAARYERALYLRADAAHGKVCWDTAKHLHNKGVSPEIAAVTASHPFKR